jgi:hypothetical protein
MKKYVELWKLALRVPAFLLAVLFLVVSLSCKSAPEQAEEPVDPGKEAPEVIPGVSPEVTSDALQKIISRVEEARKRTVDFESPSYFPSEWEAIDRIYNDAKRMPVSSDSEIDKAAEQYNSAADRFDELFGKTVPLYAQAREDEIMAVRDGLFETGLASLYFEYLQPAEQAAILALNQYEAQDYYSARDTAAIALNEYEMLAIAARVYILREELVDREFFRYDPENFDKADEIAESSIDQYLEGNKDTAVNYAEEAEIRYKLIMANSWPAYAGDKQHAAFAERVQASIHKADIAVYDIYNNAEIMYEQAESALEAEDFQRAGILFADAEALFALSSRETENKRLNALEAMRRADERIEVSGEAAIEAERIIEGGSR